MDVVDDAMKVSILASSSSGNVTYIETPQHKVLVDAGLSGKKVADLMKSINRDIADVDSLLVTHEHADHIRGVGVLARKYQLDVYANELTWDAIGSKVGEIPVTQKHLFDTGKTMNFGDLDIQSFGVSHDAAAPQFYEFHHAGKSFVILTDTGYVSDRIRGTIEDADAYLFECNHDIEMLRMGLYPWPLKQRILGDKGHLSNEDGASALMDVVGNRTKRIYLGHLSPENNLKALANLTVTTMMEEKDFAVGDAFKILDTDATEATNLFVV